MIRGHTVPIGSVCLAMRCDRSSSLCVVTFSAPLSKRLDSRFARQMAQAPSVGAMAPTEVAVETIGCQKLPGIKGKVRFHIVVVNIKADMTLSGVGGGRPVTNDDECCRLNEKWRERRVLVLRRLRLGVRRATLIYLLHEKLFLAIIALPILY